MIFLNICDQHGISRTQIFIIEKYRIEAKS